VDLDNCSSKDGTNLASMHYLIHGQETTHELAPQSNGCHMDVPATNPTTPMVNVPRLDLEVQVHKMVVEAFAKFDNL
jgi:hypothetical protein